MRIQGVGSGLGNTLAQRGSGGYDHFDKNCSCVGCYNQKKAKRKAKKKQ